MDWSKRGMFAGSSLIHTVTNLLILVPGSGMIILGRPVVELWSYLDGFQL